MKVITVRNLGVFDNDYNFRQHISCKSCFYLMRDLRRIRRRISISTAKTISTALISSCLDYCKIVWHVWYSGRLGFHHHYLYLNSYTGFILHIELIVCYPFLHIVFYLHNNHPTWLVSCIFQISLGSSSHQFHNNLLCLKQNLTRVNVLSLSQRLGLE